LGYARGLGLIATLIGLFTWELLQVCIREVRVVAKSIYIGTSSIFLDLELIYFLFL